MLRLQASAAAAAVLALLVSGCGPKAADNLSGKSTAQMVSAASSNISGKSFRATYSVTFSADASRLGNISRKDRASFQLVFGSPITVHGTVAVESPQRMKLTLTGNSLLAGKEVTAVLYDGETYQSEDGGKTYTRQRSSAQGLAGDAQPKCIKPSDFSQLADLYNYTDQGSEAKDGVQTHHLRAVITNQVWSKFFTAYRDLLSKCLTDAALKESKVSASQIDEVITAVKAALTFSDTHFDIWLDQSSGNLVHESGAFKITIDMDKLTGVIEQLAASTGTPLSEGTSDTPTGTMTLSLDTFDFAVSGVGSAVHVDKPTVSSVTPTPTALFS